MKSAESFSPTKIDGKQNTDNLHCDPYGTDIKSLSEFEKLDTVTQLNLLSITIEAANADTWYAVSSAKSFFDVISGSNRFSPLIRIIADCAKITDPYEKSAEYLIEQEEHIDKHCGYDSIALPGSIYLNRDLESLSEQELESRLNGLEDGSTVIPEIYYDESSYYYELKDELQRRIFDDNQKGFTKNSPHCQETNN